MTDERAYRVHLRFEAAGNKFVARAPELDLSAEGPSRAEAIAHLEQEIEARIQGAAGGETLPPPVDLRPVNGTVAVKLSQSLARELEFQASLDGITPDALAAGLIARGLGALEGRGGTAQRRRGPPPPARSSEASTEEQDDAQPAEDPRAREQREQRGGDRGGDRGRGRGGDRGGDRRREGYRPELDDKANFLEYLRGLEKGGGGGRGRR